MRNLLNLDDENVILEDVTFRHFEKIFWIQ